MKTIYAEAQPGKVVLKEKEIPAPGKGEVLLKAKYSAMSPGTENGLLGCAGIYPAGAGEHQCGICQTTAAG